jgi:hypothetical protein
MVDIRFKSKKIKDAKEQRMRKIELKRYLESFTPETRNQAQLLMSSIHQHQHIANRYGYLSFIAIAITVAGYSFGLWEPLYGKFIMIVSAAAFAVFLFLMVFTTYKTDKLKRELGELRILGHQERKQQTEESFTKQ